MRGVEVVRLVGEYQQSHVELQSAHPAITNDSVVGMTLDAFYMRFVVKHWTLLGIVSVNLLAGEIVCGFS